VAQLTRIGASPNLPALVIDVGELAAAAGITAYLKNDDTLEKAPRSAVCRGEAPGSLTGHAGEPGFVVAPDVADASTRSDGFWVCSRC
jgi:hypothetical protein